MKRVWLILCFVLWIGFPVRAQEDMPASGALFTLTSEGSGFLIEFPMTEWHPDSQSFLFQWRERDSNYRPTLFQYFLPSNELRGLMELPTQLEISGQQAVAWDAASQIVFTSPNGRYAIYTTSEQLCSEICTHYLGLADLETDAHFTLRMPFYRPQVIRWSADSSAVLMVDEGAYGGVGGVWYARVPDDFAQTAVVEAHLLTYSSTGDIGFVDISPDGGRVLVRGVEGGRLEGLFVWDASAPDTGEQFAALSDGRFILKGETVAGASFIPSDNQHILAVLERGIVRYDLATGDIEVLDPTINADWVTWAYFSPDARYVLTYRRLETGSTERLDSQIALYAVGS
jgi:hypothetical protein